MSDLLLKNFIRVSSIPRESGNESKIADFFVDIAKENDFYYYKDDNNNVLIRKPGNNNKEPLGIQAHLDMVCEKEKDSIHNFDTDPIEVIVEDDKVRANNTSLGADQGVGLAMMLTLIEDKELNSPTLEFIFTVEEETNFNGACTFPYNLLTTKRIINLDSCNDDVVYIGSEADIANQYTYKLNYIDNDSPTYRMEITTPYGGNSGEYIKESKNNAIYKTCEILKDMNIQLISISGGKNEDDIANKCIVEFSTNDKVDNLTNIEKIDNKKSLSIKDTKELFKNILLMKSGFINNNISANLGYIETNNNKIEFYYLMRSKNDKELVEYNELINSKIINLEYEEMYSDDSFIISKDSKLLNLYKNIYKEMYKEEVKEEICTGGIECSIIANSIANLDIISVGSTVNYFHTTKEETYISSWIKIYKILLELLNKIN